MNRLADIVADQAVQELLRRVEALERDGKLISGVQLEDARDTPIRHGLNRRAAVFVSPVRGSSSSGRVTEIRSGDYDGTNVVVLHAVGFGATVTVDLWVK